jgi:hypothetical protein
VALRPTLDTTYLIIPPRGQRLASIREDGRPLPLGDRSRRLRAGRIYKLAFVHGEVGHARS